MKNIQSMSDKRISIIVPVYNVEAYIEKCITSLIGQTYSNLEILLVDDGSTDDSGQICDRYAEKDERICVLHKDNGGLSDARNYGIDRAKGDLLAFVDGDDWIHPQMYELMLDILEAKNADIVTCGFEQRDEGFANRRYTLEQLEITVLSGAEALSDLWTPSVVAWNKLYQKKIFDQIRYPKGKLHEDEYVIHKIFYQCKNIAVIDKPLYFYTIRQDSIVARMTPQRIDNTLEALADRVAFADSMGWTEVMSAVVKRYCDYCLDRYVDIINNKYEAVDNSYLDILWRSEHNMLQRYANVKIDKIYRIFAESSEKYCKRLAKIDRRNQRRALFWRVMRRLIKGQD